MARGRGLQRSVGVSGRLPMPSSCPSSRPTLTLRLTFPSPLLSSLDTWLVMNWPERTMECVLCLQSDTGVGGKVGGISDQI